MDRRRFLATGAMAGVASLLASACGDGQIGNVVSGPGTGGTATVVLADYPVLSTVGGMARLTGTSRPVAVVRVADGFRAFSLVCPHQGSTVAIVNGTSFQCPNHGARFSASGQWTGGERTGNLTELVVTPGPDGRTITVTY